MGAFLKLFKKDKAPARRFLTDYSCGRALLALDQAKQRSKELTTRFWSE